MPKGIIHQIHHCCIYVDIIPSERLRNALAAMKKEVSFPSWSCRRKIVIASLNANRIQRCFCKYYYSVLPSLSQDLKCKYELELMVSHSSMAAAVTMVQALVWSQMCRRRLYEIDRIHAHAATLIQSVFRSWK